MSRLIAPLLMALALALAGHAKGGWPVGLLLGAFGAATTWMLGAMLRGRSMRRAPAGPPLRPGERPLLHGPVEVLSAGEERRCWAYLSDQRLSLLPVDEGEGVTLELAALDEIRPAREGFFGGGELGVASQGRGYTLRVPHAKRWEAALKQGLRS